MLSVLSVIPNHTIIADKSKTRKDSNVQYYQVLISAEIRPQGLNILDHLISKQLVLGGPVFSGPAKFLWKGDSSALPGLLNEGLAMDRRKLEVVDHDYCFVVTYTREDLKQELIEEAEKVSVEEVCMISFMPIEGNAALIKLLEDSFADRDAMSSPPEHIKAMAALTFVNSAEIPYRTNKSLNLPVPIANYFNADKGNAEAVSQCFTENAVVKDEGQTYRSRAAIKQWKADAAEKYQYTSKPFAFDQEQGKTVVTSHLTGNFPGSPVNLRYFFELEGDKIKSLEIIALSDGSKIDGGRPMSEERAFRNLDGRHEFDGKRILVEIFNLKWFDLDFERGVIQVRKTKTKLNRVVPMNARVREVLNQQRRSSEFVFTSEKTGGRLVDVKKAFDAARIDAKIPDFQLRDLRHSCATRLSDQGEELVTVAEILGHTDIRMTKRYSHAMQD